MSSSSSAPPIRAGISDSIPSTGMPSARRSSSSRRAGLFSCARASTAARSRTSAGEQQLAAAGGVQHVDGGDRPLVRDGEAAQLADLVAPELDADRVLRRRGEDVDDAAAHGELAASGDHLDARVGQLDEPDQQVVEVVLVADPQRHRVQPAQAGRDRLDQAARGGHDEPRRGGRIGERAEDREAAPDGVRARREPLVRQGLPAGQHGDGVAAEQVRRGRAEVLRLPVRGGDGEGGAAAGEQGGEERAQRRGPFDRQRRHPGGAQIAGGGGEGAEVGVGGCEQTGELGHGILAVSARTTDPCPGRAGARRQVTRARSSADPRHVCPRSTRPDGVLSDRHRMSRTRTQRARTGARSEQRRSGVERRWWRGAPHPRLKEIAWSTSTSTRPSTTRSGVAASSAATSSSTPTSRRSRPSPRTPGR